MRSRFRFLLLLILCPLAAFGQALTPGQQAKLPPALRPEAGPVFFPRPALDPAAGPYQAFDEKNEPLYDVIIYTEDPAAIAAAGVHVNTRVANFVTARVTAAQAQALSQLDPVRRIALSTYDTPELDVSLAATGAHLLHAGFVNNTPYQGEGAIVMIIDSGIDFGHPDFIDPATGQSRILRIWDQTITGTPPFPFSYGAEFSQGQLNAVLSGGGTVGTSDTNGHGTHVAGIAVGNGRATPGLVGMAPKADIVVVKSNFQSSGFIDALSYADQLATQFNKPIVVNYSAGGHLGPHDGTSPHEVAIDAFSQKPGRVVVNSAGNSGADRIHLNTTIAPGETKSLRFSIPSYTARAGEQNDFVLIDLWYEADADVTLALYSPTSLLTIATPGTDANSIADTDGMVYLANEVVQGNLKNLRVQVFDNTATKPPRNGDWRIELSQASAPITVDGWMWNQTVGALLYPTESDTRMTISIPGTSREVITVGSYATRGHWYSIVGKRWYAATPTLGNISSFSSTGPTRDGRMKPDLTAPGHGIFSAYSSTAPTQQDWVHPGGKHRLTQGTSMAAPHVAGAVALMLGARPTLTNQEIKQLLTASAVPKSQQPNDTWGHGQMDVLRALLLALDPNATTQRERLVYTTTNPYFAFPVSPASQAALRFTPSFSGKVTGAHLLTSDVTGSGDVVVSVHTAENGQPGSQIGESVAFPFSRLDVVTFIDLIASGAAVEAGQDYFLVFASTGGTLSISGGGGDTPARSYTSVGATWSAAAGELFVSPEIAMTSDPAVAIEDVTGTLPGGFDLSSGFPNPFVEAANFTLALKETQHVRVEVLNVLGQRVAVLHDGLLASGTPHLLTFRADDHPPGLYVLRATGESFSATKKVTRVR